MVRRFVDEDPERTLTRGSGRRARGIAAAAVSAAAVAAVSAALMWGASAGATPALIAQIPAPTPTVIPDNPNTCEEAGIGGEILLSGEAQGNNNAPDASGPAGTATVSGDGTTLDVTINAGFTATGIVVKGGNAANLYSGPFVGPITIEDMISPPVGQGNTPQISHYFVCGMTSATTTPPTTTTAPPTTTTTAAPATATTTTTPGLPVTGGATIGLVAAGVALVSGGAALLLLRRRRAASGE
jgi:LPXTG-motif cell wall-anchored protein